MHPQVIAAAAASQLPADSPGADPALSKADFRQAMSRLGAAVNIVTTDGAAGRAGFTASAVCSVTDEPPMLLVCLNRNASVYDAVKANGVLCVNALGAGHQDLSNLFGGKTPMVDRFAAAQWASGHTGAPVLTGAPVAFDCRVVGCTSVGTHDVLFCAVQAVILGEAAHGLMYFGRKYHELDAAH
ncbi:pyrimidine utilization flavin reductase protein F [Roseateles aquatilis]|uniref:FMN reductase (NADH) RutF n=1 Tax=Roseateles aquatilis TaxID=431061 RepID=A0A246JDT1_9BURK|nr:pyrimidine utilization flavin reductase protein F [Roseateles aquatilis]OWQ90738.1 pyrimidine utilization flavin reductase protein F [Roseateles aquatilis]